MLLVLLVDEHFEFAPELSLLLDIEGTYLEYIWRIENTEKTIRTMCGNEWMANWRVFVVCISVLLCLLFGSRFENFLY